MQIKLTRTQLIELVKRIMAADGTEDELEQLEDILERNVTDPEVGDLIYYASPPLTPEEIVDKALSYKPIVIPEKEE